MAYLTLLESSGSYVGLGIPLVRHGGSCILNGSDTKSGTFSTSDWFGVSVACGARDSDKGEATISVFGCSSPLWSCSSPVFGVHHHFGPNLYHSNPIHPHPGY